MKNKEKQTKYAILMKKLDIATREEFYFEAILIEYAILEDRTESILRHANINVPRGLQRKLNILKENKTFQNEKNPKAFNSKVNQRY